MNMKNIVAKCAVVSGLVFAAVVPAFAAVGTEVSTALTEAKTDVTTIGGLVLVVIIAAAAFKYLRRAL